MLRLAVSSVRPQVTASRVGSLRATSLPRSRVFCSVKSADKHPDISLVMGLSAGTYDLQTTRRLTGRASLLTGLVRTQAASQECSLR